MSADEWETMLAQEEATREWERAGGASMVTFGPGGRLFALFKSGMFDLAKIRELEDRNRAVCGADDGGQP